MNLNETSAREKYKVFSGKNTEQMELLIKDKRIPMTMKQIIERRLHSSQEDWKNNYFDTCDAIVYGEDRNKIKIVKNCKILKDMDSKTKLIFGRIKITPKQYEKLKGKEFLIDEKEGIWRYLLEDLYDDYIKLVGFIPNVLTFYEENTLAAAYVDWLEIGSQIDGWNRLDDGGGRLVGVASEMHIGDAKMTHEETTDKLLEGVA